MPTRRRTPTSTRRRTSSRTSRSSRSSASRRRRTPTVAAGIGTALGTFLVAWLVSTSWPVRIGLVLLALLAVMGYALWRDRSSRSAAGEAPEGAEDGAEPTGAPGSTEPPAPSAGPPSAPPA